VFEDLIAGNDCQEQNDNGFFIEINGGVVIIKIDPHTENGDNGETYTKFTLPHVICRHTFMQLQPIMQRLWPNDN
jgi:hypothetical protein